MSHHNIKSSQYFWQFVEDMKTLLGMQPPRTLSNNARNNPAQQPHVIIVNYPTQSEISREEVQNSFGLLPLETEAEFITIVSNNSNLVDALRNCVWQYSFNAARHTLNDHAAQQVAESMAGNARAQMTQQPQNFDLKPVIYENLAAAIRNKHNEINSRY